MRHPTCVAPHTQNLHDSIARHGASSMNNSNSSNSNTDFNTDVRLSLLTSLVGSLDSETTMALLNQLLQRSLTPGATNSQQPQQPNLDLLARLKADVSLNSLVLAEAAKLRGSLERRPSGDSQPTTTTTFQLLQALRQGSVPSTLHQQPQPSLSLAHQATLQDLLTTLQRQEQERQEQQQRIQLLTSLLSGSSSSTTGPITSKPAAKVFPNSVVESLYHSLIDRHAKGPNNNREEEDASHNIFQQVERLVSETNTPVSTPSSSDSNKRVRSEFEGSTALNLFMLQQQQQQGQMKKQRFFDIKEVWPTLPSPEQQKFALNSPFDPLQGQFKPQVTPPNPPDRYKKWQMEDNFPLLKCMTEKGRKWEAVKEAVNSSLGTSFSYGRVKHRCRHLLQEKRGDVHKKHGQEVVPFTDKHLQTALKLHAIFKDRFHLIRSFSKSTKLPQVPGAETLQVGELENLMAFPIAKIETEILRHCTCESCASMGLIKAQRLGEKEFLEEWTKVKSHQLHTLLSLHMEHGMEFEKVRQGMQWGSDWTDKDIDYRIRHVCNACPACTMKTRKKTRRTSFTSETNSDYSDPCDQ